MTVIHSVGEIEIKNIKKNKYSITSDPYFSSFFSLYNIEHKREMSDIIFTCKTIETLKEFIENNSRQLLYDAVVKLIYDIGFAIKSLEQKEKAILCFGLDDIMVINENIFFFINTSKILPIVKQQITLKIPIDIKGCFLPSDTNWKGLPIKTHYKTGFYSFALLVIYLLTETHYEKGKTDILNPISNTKLYYFILRCLKDDPYERTFLYI